MASRSLSLATKECHELEEVYGRKLSLIQKNMQRVESHEKQSQIVHEQHLQSTQAEESEIEERLKELQDEFDAINSKLSSLKEEEKTLFETFSKRKEEVERISHEVTAFRGYLVTRLLQAIERHHHRLQLF